MENQKQQNEKWLPVAGTEKKYWISDSGQVRRNGRILKPATLPVTRYQTVCLSLYGVKYIRYVHELVANAFLGNSAGKYIGHLDCNQSNNNLWNLEYMDKAQYTAHKRRCFPGRKNVKQHEVEKMFELRSQGAKVTDIAKLFHVPQPTVSKILNGSRKSNYRASK